MRGRDAPLRRPSTCGARRSLDSAEDPSPDAESSEPSVATELGVRPMEDDETELDDASPVFDHEAAPVLAESAAPALMTTDEATEALDILHHLSPCLPTGKTLAAEVDRLELDLQRAILIQTKTLAAAASAPEQQSLVLHIAEGGSSPSATCRRDFPSYAEEQFKEQATANNHTHLIHPSPRRPSRP